MSQIQAALIGAAGVAVGGVLTGGFTLLKGRQDGQESRKGRDEARRSARLDRRRATSQVFLQRIHAVTIALNELWLISAAADEGEWRAADAAVDEAFDEVYGSYLAVAIAGPQVLADEAESLWLAGVRAQEQLEALWLRRAEGEPGDVVGGLLGDEEDSRQDDFVRRQKQFLLLSRRLLDGEPTDLDSVVRERRWLIGRRGRRSSGRSSSGR